MKGFLVDSNVILDVFLDDPDWADWSESILTDYSVDSTLYINAVIYTEVSVGFDRIEELETAMHKGGFQMLELPKEALFLAGIRPTARASRVTRVGYDRLVAAIRSVLQGAIDMGGTTMRDFVNQDGNPGYFKQSLNVYGRLGLPCRRCATPLKGARTGQRATVFCPNCQGAQSFSGRNR